MLSGSDIRVSILVATYNQVGYVEEALESVLAQRTTFATEILVHDDASTDGTAEVLLSFAERHPGRVRLFLEDHNRHAESARRGYFTSLLAPEARGDYVAFLEGDDFWCDQDKLQRQFDYLESHPTCSECVHRARRVDATTGELVDLMGMGEEERDLSACDIIGAWDVPTASRLIRRSLLPAYARDWTFDKPAGDFPLAVYLASCGYTHHDPMVASVYRLRRPGSYSATTLDGLESARNALRWLVMLDEIDARTGGSCHDAIKTHVDAYADVLSRWIEGEPARHPAPEPPTPQDPAPRLRTTLLRDLARAVRRRRHTSS